MGYVVYYYEIVWFIQTVRSGRSILTCYFLLKEIRKGKLSFSFFEQRESTNAFEFNHFRVIFRWLNAAPISKYRIVEIEFSQQSTVLFLGGIWKWKVSHLIGRRKKVSLLVTDHFRTWEMKSDSWFRRGLLCSGAYWTFPFLSTFIFYLLAPSPKDAY